MSGNTKKYVIVVGAGIVGASTAYQLAQAGCRVTLLDRDAPGGVASPCSFGWTNSSYRNAQDYHLLRCHSMRLWDQLAESLDGVPYRRSGSLYLDDKLFDLDDFYAQHSQRGYELQWLTKDQVQELEPSLLKVPERGILAPGEGAVEADDAARFFAAACASHAECTVVKADVSGLIAESGRVSGVIADGTHHHADEVVLAAGVETERLAAEVGIRVPLVTSPGLLIQTTPTRRRIERLILAVDVHFRQRPDGVLLAGEDFSGGEVDDDPEGIASGLLTSIRGQLTDSDDIGLSRYTIGYRPLPSDGRPIVGRGGGVDGLYIAVMHSGATLAPAIGQMVAREIVEGDRDPLLGPFGVDRFAG